MSLCLATAIAVGGRTATKTARENERFGCGSYLSIESFSNKISSLLCEAVRLNTSFHISYSLA